MASLNRVFLMGNLTRDPELRYTPSGTAVCEFGLAVNRTYTTRDGEKREDTCFVDITVWQRRGVVVSEYFKKGDPIFVEGRLKYDSWDSPDGRRSKLSVTATNFEFIGRGGSGGQGGGRARSGADQGAPARDSRQAPAARRSRQEPDEPSEEGFDVSDDEIPF